jgi:hypothetical protein
MAHHSHFRVAQYDAALMVWSLGMNAARRTPFLSQKTVAMTFRVDNVFFSFIGFYGE